MNETYEKILTELRKHPKGIRARYIASAVGMWTPTLACTLSDMEKLGLVRNVYIHHPENMEFYYLWFVAE